ncbi:MAG: DUF2779 domain-containing protein [Methylophilus sp.]|nr:DUF2779 domain-containing protein [Methylophilus sp.]
MKKNSNRYLTKSRFKLAVECPTKLFYSGKPKEYCDTMQENAFLAMLAEGGYQVGALAKLRYPDGIEIVEKTHAEAHATTQVLLQQENVILFEPAILFGAFFIRIDILIKQGNRFELIEVKAKSYDSMSPEIEGKRGGISSGMLPYIQDAAFQTWVLQQAFPNTEIATALMMPDKAHSSKVDGVNQMFKITARSTVEVNIPPEVDAKQLAETLLTKVNVDAYVTQVLASPIAYPSGQGVLSDVAPAWASAYQHNEKIAPAIGAQCGGCQFKAPIGDSLKSGFHECWQQANDWTDKDFTCGTVLDLWNFKKKQKLMEQGIYKISQITRDDIGTFEDEVSEAGLNRMQRQWLQVGGIPADYDCDGYYFDKGYARVNMAAWKYPYHFIDFETSAVALPFHAGMRPYEQVAFQFSHHVMEADGSVRHAGEFICVEPGVFPNYEFAHALKAELEQDNGTVFMWSHHENTIVSTILRQLSQEQSPPEDAESLTEFLKMLIKGGRREMVDLCTFAEKAFFHPDTKGSNSIKQVLPAILRVSPILREIYSKPIYGAPDGIQSLNFSSDQGYSWIDILADGSATEPYARLKQYAKNLLSEDDVDETSVIAEGGAAATAYAKLQFESLSNEARKKIIAALLRYCELDTLAMVMIVQAWQYDAR